MGVDRHAQREPDAALTQVPGILAAPPALSLRTSTGRSAATSCPRARFISSIRSSLPPAGALPGRSRPASGSPGATRGSGRPAGDGTRALIGARHACRAFVGIAVGEHQDGVRVHDQQLDSEVGTGRPGCLTDAGPKPALTPTSTEAGCHLPTQDGAGGGCTISLWCRRGGSRGRRPWRRASRPSDAAAAVSVLVGTRCGARWDQRDARLVEEDEPGRFCGGPFLIRGHSC